MPTRKAVKKREKRSPVDDVLEKLPEPDRADGRLTRAWWNQVAAAEGGPEVLDLLVEVIRRRDAGDPVACQKLPDLTKLYRLIRQKVEPFGLRPADSSCRQWLIRVREKEYRR